MRRLAAEAPDALLTSAICLYELRHGALRGPDGARRWDRIAKALLPRVAVVPFGPDEALRAGEVSVALDATGTPIGLEDILIGATALVRGVAVVTRNARHLARIPGLRVLDWWA